MQQKNPHQPTACQPMGVQTGGTNKAVTLLTHGLTNANPMPRKKNPQQPAHLDITRHLVPE